MFVGLEYAGMWFSFGYVALIFGGVLPIDALFGPGPGPGPVRLL